MRSCVWDVSSMSTSVSASWWHEFSRKHTQHRSSDISHLADDCDMFLESQPEIKCESDLWRRNWYFYFMQPRKDLGIVSVFKLNLVNSIAQSRSKKTLFCSVITFKSMWNPEGPQSKTMCFYAIHPGLHMLTVSMTFEICRTTPFLYIIFMCFLKNIYVNKQNYMLFTVFM